MDLPKKPYASLCITFVGALLLFFISFVNFYDSLIVSKTVVADMTQLGNGLFFGALAYQSLRKRLLKTEQNTNAERSTEYLFIVTLGFSFLSGISEKTAGHHVFAVIPLAAIIIYFWTTMTFFRKK
ncbi:MAG: hypothetical protein JWM56_810 [Candidatus Peribacteria bacterium]|nr:hypothetical protein [Candidatus Peribacteria bacterium]